MMFSHKMQWIGPRLYNHLRSALLTRSTTTILRPLARTIHSTGGLDVQTAPLPSTATPLQKILQDSIRAKGPISVAQYMQMCLSHPVEGYYMKGEPIGARGDFITSPEISQLFGELVGIWLVSQWVERGQNRPIRMIELGPGKGTLMDDILRVSKILDLVYFN
ncbi:S-adenosyl-L-methionine-dependent methyltransferase, putative [Rhizoctonia solani AG-3 Rhs1AP]|uniref:Protein arginine methyltransferase NDUFAF7 n=1 Tax=Rhizoctonia solani AG-3 Rhs1AP TaxID=1086054 RepID=X8J6C8_9AGAM|nr:S-adenosyl-L-methionine-dependent methyltransferase, putative [Rhizoctonia solani AG-3 Rhs1AP]